MEKREDGTSNPARQILAVKGIYTSPTLVGYGSVAKLTQNGRGSGADGGGAADMMMMCL